jgi:hypothetical protein
LFAKAFLNVDNIETFFGAVEMGLLLNTFPGTKPEELGQLRTALVDVIVKSLESSIQFESNSEGIVLPEPWAAFGLHLQKLIGQNRAKTADWTFLTFNYDILLDLTLSLYGVPFDYCLNGMLNDPSIPLLKLHGSINWAYCQQCKEIVPQSLAGWTGRIKPGFKTFGIPIGTNIRRIKCKRCSTTFTDPPVLVPPTWDKGKYHASVQPVWRAAASRLSTAENLVIVGYSLPESDAFFRYLYALGTTGPTRIKSVTVIDPDLDGSLKTRITHMVGRGIAHRVEFVGGEPGKWEHAFNRVSAMLAQ